MSNKRLNAVITIGGTVTGALKSALGSTRTNLQKIGSTVRDLEREQRKLGAATRDAMNQGRPIGALYDQYRRLGVQIGKTRREQERMNKAVRSMDKGRAMMANAVPVIGAAVAVAATAFAPVIMAASFERAMLGVAKQVDGARDAGGRLTKVYYDMARSVQLLGREIPVPTNELAKMVEQGARMGVPKERLIDFVRSVAKLGVALDIPKEELADSMGKIATLFKIPVPDIEKLGDAINFLDDNAISKGGDIIDFLTRTGGVAGNVKVTATQMTALGSTLLSLGERSETASTATNAFFQKLAAADKGSKKFQRGLADLGLTAEQVQKGMQIDAQGTILQVIEAVNKLPQEKRLGALTDLVGLEHSDTIAKLAANVGEYRRQIELVNSQKAQGSVGREYAAQLASTAAQWEITKNRMVEVGVNVGSVLLPPLNKALGVIGSVASATATWASAHPQLTKNILIFGGALAGSIGILKAVTFGVRAIPVALNVLKLACMTNPLGLAFVALTTGAALIYENWTPISGFFIGIWNKVKGPAAAVWTWLKDGFLNWTPLGLVIKNWGPISGAFGAIWGAIKVGAGAVWEFLKFVWNWSPMGLVINNWKPLTEFFSGFWKGVKDMARGAIDWIIGAITRIGEGWRAAKRFFGFGGGDSGNAPTAPAPGGGRRPPALPPMATGRSGGGGGGGVQGNTFNFYQQPGQSSGSLSRQVMGDLDKRDRFRRGGVLFDAPQGM